jgi:integrase
VAALAAPPRRARARTDDALDADEAAAVLKAASGDRLEALAVLVLATGLRQGEALRLRWDDIDFDAATLTVREAKTPAGVRTIALPGIVTTALRDHRARQRLERLAAAQWDDPGVVFASDHGGTMHRTDALRYWWALTIRAGVGRRRFHASRHTAATLMLNNGVPLEVVSKTLGHAGLAITADVYAKVRPELQRTAATAMDRVLGGER